MNILNAWLLMKFRLGSKDAIKYSKVGMKIEGSDNIDKPLIVYVGCDPNVQ